MLRALTTHRWTIATLLAVAGAALLRLPRLGWTFFGDEVWVVHALHVGRYIPHVIPQPPLFFFSALAASRLCGFGEICLRMPAFLFAIALSCIPFAARKTIGDFATFVWSALLAFSSPYVFYGSRLKQYTAESTVAALLLVLFIHVARDLDDRKRLRNFFIAACVAALTCHAAPFLLLGTGAAFVAVALLERRGVGPIVRIAAIHAVSAALFLFAYFAYTKPGPDVYGGDLDAYFVAEHRFFDGTLHFVREQTSLWLGQMLNLTSGFLLIAIASFALLAIRRRNSPLAIGIVIAAIVPPLAVLAASAAHIYPYGEVRLMAFAAPGCFLVIALAFAELVAMHRLFELACTFVIAVFIAREVVHDPYDTTYMRTFDQRAIYDFVARKHPRGVPLLVREWESVALAYYASNAARDFVLAGRTQPAIAPTAAEVWMVESVARPLRVDGGYECIERFAERELRVRRCTRTHS
jgi:hypothetical protein